jgi:hypothetical protein
MTFGVLVSRFAAIQMEMVHVLISVHPEMVNYLK